MDVTAGEGSQATLSLGPLRKDVRKWRKLTCLPCAAPAVVWMWLGGVGCFRCFKWPGEFLTVVAYFVVEHRIISWKYQI